MNQPTDQIGSQSSNTSSVVRCRLGSPICSVMSIVLTQTGKTEGTGIFGKVYIMAAKLLLYARAKQGEKKRKLMKPHLDY